MYVPLTEADKGNPPSLSELLSYCNTCQIVRPPRSFHCRECNVCIEVHDHHCPWVGSCIGRRNLRYFVLFLFNASFICLYTCLLCFCAFITGGVDIFKGDQSDKGLQFYLKVINFILMIYTLVLAFSLSSFGL